MLRWAQECYGLDPKRLVLVSRGGVDQWYYTIGHRYVDLFDLHEPADFSRFAVDGRNPTPEHVYVARDGEIVREVRKPP